MRTEIFHATAQRRKERTLVFRRATAPPRESNSIIRILRQCEAELTIVEVDHQVLSHKLLERRVEPLSVVELRRNVLLAASVAAVLVEICVQIRIARAVLRTVTPILDLNRGPSFSITQVRLRSLFPTSLP